MSAPSRLKAAALAAAQRGTPPEVPAAFAGSIEVCGFHIAPFSLAIQWLLEAIASPLLSGGTISAADISRAIAIFDDPTAAQALIRKGNLDDHAFATYATRLQPRDIPALAEAIRSQIQAALDASTSPPDSDPDPKVPAAWAGPPNSSKPPPPPTAGPPPTSSTCRLAPSSSSPAHATPASPASPQPSPTTTKPFSAHSLPRRKDEGRRMKYEG